MKSRVRRLASCSCIALAACLGIAGAGREARALINPKFTPVHLVHQAQMILELRFQPEVKRGKAVAGVVRALKGKTDQKSVTIDLAASNFPDQARLAARMIKDANDRPALLFFGGVNAKEGDAAGDAPAAAVPKAYLHLDAKWLELSQDAKAGWAFDQMSQPMIATWNGGTDMLLRAVEYILKSPGPEVPVRSGVAWAEAIPAGRIAGKVSAAVPVDLAGDGKLLLMIASDAGDRLVAFEKRAARDVTAAHRLASKSLAFAWGDFSGDGRLDLASWDGRALALHRQGRDGTFTAGDGGKLAECRGLAAVQAASPGKAALIVSTAAGPQWLVPGAGARPVPLAPGEWPGEDLGEAGACLVADFDGNGLPDVLQPLAKGSLFYSGVAPGVFAAPKPCALALGQGPAAACLGDWDGDGRLDVFVAGEEACRLWQNLGDGRFAECLKLSGELGYVAKPAAVAAAVGDLNNDGRPDLAVCYRAMTPQIFFNRGFRSFGFSQSLDLERGGKLPAAAQGQQAACLADFHGTGAQDLALVLADGTCWLAVRTPGGGELAARVVLGPKSRCAGPVTVRAAIDDRPLGAWHVTAGGPGAFLARPEAGPITIHWRFPGGHLQSREVILEDRPVTLALMPSQ
jgi:hypothetical protein